MNPYSPFNISMYMNKYFSSIGLLLSTLLILLFSCSGFKNTVANEQAIDKRLDNALLWKVTGNGLSTPSYVYGTIHIIDNDDYFLPDGTLAAMDAAKEIVFEIDMNEMTDISAQMGLMKKAFMKDDITLSDLISEGDYELVKAHFKKMGLPLFLFEKMKPMFLTVFAGNDFDPMSLQNGDMKSYEMEMFEIANKTGKSVAGLETMDFQISLFDSIPYKDQATMLVESIKASDVGAEEFKTMVALYLSQDVDGMYEMTGSEEGGVSGYEETLINQRNRNWIPQMKEKMKNHTTFFAVGAGHLGGDQGVIRLLKREGYTLTPISPKVDAHTH